MKMSLKTDNEQCKNLLKNIKSIVGKKPDFDIDEVSVLDKDGTKKASKFTENYKDEKGVKKVLEYLDDAGENGIKASNKIVNQVSKLKGKKKLSL